MEELFVKRMVAFVNGYISVITVIQFKKAIFPDERFDIIISDLTPGLKKIYESKVLEEEFEKVYFSQYSSLKRINKAFILLSPNKMIQDIVGESLPYYTDIFFWNPTLMFYSYIMYLNTMDRGYNLHSYGEALGAYVTDHPIEEPLFKYNFLNVYLKKRYGYILVENMEYDYYVFGQELVSFNSDRNIVSIPKLTQDCISYLNKVFNYEDYKNEIKEKFIFMDKYHKDEMNNENMIISLLDRLTSSLGRGSFAVKAHPRQDKSFYLDNNIKLIEMDFPWELYCLNNNIDDKIIISYSSSAMYMPYILSDSDHVSISLELKTPFSDLFFDEYHCFIEKLRKRNKKVYCFSSVDELIRGIEENDDNS